MLIVEDGKINEFFNLNEMKCPCCNRVKLNVRVLQFYEKLESFRGWYGRPIRVNSSYRCKSHNKKVGGVDTSYHLEGLAIDFSLPGDFKGMSIQRKEKFISNVINKWSTLKGTSVLIYDTFIHLDYGVRKSPKNNGDIHIIDYRKNKNYSVKR